MNDLFDKAAKAQSGRPGRGGAEDRRVIAIRGAREHNLKDIYFDIPRGRLVVFTGLSGSGKSSLAFDTIYAEGQRRYVGIVLGLRAAVLGLDAEAGRRSNRRAEHRPFPSSRRPPRVIRVRRSATVHRESTTYMRLLWARVGVPSSPATDADGSQTISQMVDRIMALPEGTRLYLLAPVVRGRKGEYRKELAEFMKKGYQRVKIDGKFYEIAEAPALDKKFTHDIDSGRPLGGSPRYCNAAREPLEQALRLADGLAVAELADAPSDTVRNLASPLAGETDRPKGGRRRGPAPQSSGRQKDQARNRSGGRCAPAGVF